MRWLVVSLSLFLCAGVLFAEENKTQETKGSGSNRFGMGITLFGPTGITGKYFLDDKKSLEGSIGFSSYGNGRFHAHGVFLLNLASINENFHLYGGIGGVFEERYYTERRGKKYWLVETDEYEGSLGARAPVGLSWRSPDKKFEFSGEIYLNLFFLGRTGADLGLAFAGRYYF